MKIHFTQYLRPDGRTRPMTVERDDFIGTMATQVAGLGYRFSIEELRTGLVSMTVDPPPGAEDDAPIAHEIVSNGLDVPFAVDRLVLAAYRRVTS